MRNIEDKDDNIGDTLPAGAFNAFIKELEAVVTSVGISLDPNAGPDTSFIMLSQAIAAYAAAGATFKDTGDATAYVLDINSSLKDPTTFHDGMKITFKANTTNTGAATVTVSGMSTKDIKKEDGTTALGAGDIVINRYATIVYNAVSGDFELIPI